MKTSRVLWLGVSLGLILPLGCSSSSPDNGAGGPDGGEDGNGLDGTTQDVATGDTGGQDSGSQDVVAQDVTGTQDTGAKDVATADAPQDAPPEANPCGLAPTTDFYVDAVNGLDTNSGAGPSCALKTITLALIASDAASHDNATIHLAAGTYSAGETFPLVVSHGRSLVGAGASTTTIQGSSAAYNTTATGSFLDTGTHFGTLVAGDVMATDGGTNYGATTLSGFTLLPAATVTTPTTGYFGLACIAGNAPNSGATPPLPSPNLVVKDVTVGPNYDSGLVIGSSPTQTTGCNATVTGSTFTGDNSGLITGACGTTNPVQSWPSAQIGDGVAADANTFSACTIDLFGEGCGSAQSFDGNHFTSGYRGIVIVSQSAQYFEILGNTFDGTAATLPMGIGLQTSATVNIAKLNGNTFTNIAESAGADTAVGGTTGYAISVAQVLQAHQNVIHDNDNGVYVGVGPAGTFDFSADGTASNANSIYCNSKLPGGATNGYDLVLAYAAGNAANFAGNVWDHATPTTSVSLTASTNGTDVVTGTSAGATLTGSTSIGTAACASGRTH